MNTEHPRLASQEEWAKAYLHLHGALGQLIDMLAQSEETIEETGAAGARSVLRNWSIEHGHYFGV